MLTSAFAARLVFEQLTCHTYSTTHTMGRKACKEILSCVSCRCSLSADPRRMRVKVGESERNDASHCDNCLRMKRLLTKLQHMLSKSKPWLDAL